mmetsp:Transcript_44038/g.121874  ORF Transcript_44038/g.121874 Transcript_44038/m.121874 type:complete len:236 (+) Transcript_44038:913-1620(+)
MAPDDACAAPRSAGRCAGRQCRESVCAGTRRGAWPPWAVATEATPPRFSASSAGQIAPAEKLRGEQHRFGTAVFDGTLQHSESAIAGRGACRPGIRRRRGATASTRARRQKHAEGVSVGEDSRRGPEARGATSQRQGFAICRQSSTGFVAGGRGAFGGVSEGGGRGRNIGANHSRLPSRVEDAAGTKPGGPRRAVPFAEQTGGPLQDAVGAWSEAETQQRGLRRKKNVLQEYDGQ